MLFQDSSLIPEKGFRLLVGLEVIIRKEKPCRSFNFRFFNFLKIIIYLFNLGLCWVFVAVRRLSPGVASWGYSVALSGLLIAAAPLAEEHRLQGLGVQQLCCIGPQAGSWALECMGSVVVTPKLCCPVACGIFLNQD